MEKFSNPKQYTTITKQNKGLICLYVLHFKFLEPTIQKWNTYEIFRTQ